MEEAEKKAAAEAKNAVDNGEDDEDSDKSSEEERPTGIVQPKYKIVHSYPHDMSDYWEGHKGTLEAG